MRIAVTSQNYRTVTPHAGRTRRFLIYGVGADGEPREVDRLYLPREMAFHDFHGEGRHPLDGVDVIIAGSFGDGFAQRMIRRGIIATTTRTRDPLQAVRAYLADLEGATLADCHWGPLSWTRVDPAAERRSAALQHRRLTRLKP